LFGIPDFRLRPDRYLSLKAEREKARRLFEAASRLNFEQLLSYYYSITDDVTPERARVYSSYVMEGAARAAEDLNAFGVVGPNAALLDAGCGAGSALVAAQGRFRYVTGIDIALRWLVLCQKRLLELGLGANLVCGDIECPPFEPGQFTHVLAADVIEHVCNQEMAVKALAGQLAPGGSLWLSTINRWWPGPHPSTGRWAAAYRPPRIGPSGYDPLRHVSQISPGTTRHLCVVAGLEVLSMEPRRVNPAHAGGRRSPAERFAIRAYARLQNVKMLRSILVAAGPAFEMLARAPCVQGESIKCEQA
jgi:2-polyprenyl-3-methyl-5-hydroxy-6-metoxy-1,4-benzoquinol methylase